MEILNSEMAFTWINSLLGAFFALVMCVGFGIAGGSIMKTKGRSAAAGFALGFFFNITGIIICAVISETFEHQIARMHRIQLNIPAQACVACGTALVPGATFCRKCGSKV